MTAEQEAQDVDKLLIAIEGQVCPRRSSSLYIGFDTNVHDVPDAVVLGTPLDRGCLSLYWIL